MSILFTRTDVGTPERNRLVARALEDVRTPPDEDWLGRVMARPGAPWEILLSGPRRQDAEGWAVTSIGGDRAQYRRLLPYDLQSAEGVKRAVRALLWKRVVVSVADPSPLGRQIEEGLWDVLTRTSFAGTEAHAAPWPSAHGGVRWAVTVERTERGVAPELAWCGVVRSAHELSSELSRAMGLTSASPVPEPLSFLVVDEPVPGDTLALYLASAPSFAVAP